MFSKPIFRLILFLVILLFARGLRPETYMFNRTLLPLNLALEDKRQVLLYSKNYVYNDYKISEDYINDTTVYSSVYRSSGSTDNNLIVYYPFNTWAILLNSTGYFKWADLNQDYKVTELLQNGFEKTAKRTEYRQWSAIYSGTLELKVKYCAYWLGVDTYRYKDLNRAKRDGVVIYDNSTEEHYTNVVLGYNLKHIVGFVYIPLSRDKEYKIKILKNFGDRYFYVNSATGKNHMLLEMEYFKEQQLAFLRNLIFAYQITNEYLLDDSVKGVKLNLALYPGISINQVRIYIKSETIFSKLFYSSKTVVDMKVNIEELVCRYKDLYLSLNRYGYITLGYRRVF